MTHPVLKKETKKWPFLAEPPTSGTPHPLPSLRSASRPALIHDQPPPLCTHALVPVLSCDPGSGSVPQVIMPRNTGVGRKHKSGTGTSSSQPAARQLSAANMPKSEAPPRKTQRRRPPPIPRLRQPPAYRSAEQVAARGEMVRIAAEELWCELWPAVASCGPLRPIVASYGKLW